MNDTSAATPARRYLVEPGARVAASARGVTVRANGRMSLVEGQGVDEFLEALFTEVVDGVLLVDPAEIDPTMLPGLLAMLDELVAVGLLVPDDGHLSTMEDVEYDAWMRAERSFAPEEISRRLRETRVRVLGEAALADPIRDLCRQSGLQVDAAAFDTAGHDESVTVVVGAHQDDAVLTSYNEKVVEAEASAPWLAVAGFDGEYAFVGPWVVPHQSACYRCFLLRRASVFPTTEMVEELSWARPIAVPGDGSIRRRAAASVVAGLAVEKIVEYVTLATCGPQTVPGGLSAVTYSERGMTVDFHRVLRVPRCPVCSPARDRGVPQVWFSVGSGTQDEPATGALPITAAT